MMNDQEFFDGLVERDQGLVRLRNAHRLATWKEDIYLDMLTHTDLAEPVMLMVSGR